jgi:hypothetical protein
MPRLLGGLALLASLWHAHAGLIEGPLMSATVNIGQYTPLAISAVVTVPQGAGTPLAVQFEWQRGDEQGAIAQLTTPCARGTTTSLSLVGLAAEHDYEVGPRASSHGIGEFIWISEHATRIRDLEAPTQSRRRRPAEVRAYALSGAGARTLQGSARVRAGAASVDAFTRAPFATVRGAPTFDVVVLDIATRGVQAFYPPTQGWLIGLDRTGWVVWENRACEGGGRAHDQRANGNVLCLGMGFAGASLKETTPLGATVAQFTPQWCTARYGGLSHDIHVDRYDDAEPVFAFEVPTTARSRRALVDLALTLSRSTLIDRSPD